MPTQRVLQYNDQVGNALKKASRIPESNAGSAETTVPRQPLMMRQAAEGGGEGGTSTIQVTYVYQGAFMTTLNSGTNDGTNGYWLHVSDGVGRESGMCGVVYLGNDAMQVPNCSAFFSSDGSTKGINAYFYVLYGITSGSGTDATWTFFTGVTLATGSSNPTATFISDGTETEVDLEEYEQAFYTPLSFIKRTGSVTNTQTYMQDYMHIDGRWL